MRPHPLLWTAVVAITTACAVDPAPEDVFWTHLGDLCGQAFEGEVVRAPAEDTVVSGKRLVMQVRTCEGSEIRIPFHVGDNRSRTWVLNREEGRIRLAHDHRHEDGVPEENTGYGGITTGPGTAERQDFDADPAEEGSNVWSMRVVPGESFVYALHREGVDAPRYEIRFDVTRAVPAPPPPWGAEEAP